MKVMKKAVLIVVVAIMAVALVGSVFSFLTQVEQEEDFLPIDRYTAYFYDENHKLIRSETYKDKSFVIFPTSWGQEPVREIAGWKVNGGNVVTSYVIDGADVEFYVVYSSGVFDAGTFEPSGTYDISDWETFVEFDDAWLDDAHWSKFY